MTFQLNSATMLTIVVPLIFLSLLGLASLARAFGYLKTANENELDEKIKWLHGWAKDFNNSINLTPLINSVTQLSGLVTVAKEASDKVAAVTTNQDFGLFALANGHRELKKCCVDLQGKVEEVENLIKKKATAGLLEQMHEAVKEVKTIVTRHDASVRSLDELHPKAEFQKGERPVHWCSASTLSNQLTEVASRAKEAVEKVDGVLKHRYDMDKDSLDNTKTIVSLLANVLSGVEGLKRDIKRLYDYIEPDEGDSHAKGR